MRKIIVLFTALILIAGSGVASANLKYGNSTWPFARSDMREIAAYSGNLLIYFGRALPGKLSNTTDWQISKFEYDVDDKYVGKSFCYKNNNYSCRWDKRDNSTYAEYLDITDTYQ